MFEITHRDSIARLGKLNDKVTTPNILFITTKRSKEFGKAEVLLTNQELKTEKFFIFDQGSAFYPIATNRNFSIPQDIPYPLSCSEFLENYCNEKICLVQNIDKVDKEAEIYVVGNSAELFRSTKGFVYTIAKLRENIGQQKIIYTPAIGLPNQYALLFYLGIDLVDSLPLVLATAEDCFLTSDSVLKKSALIETICECEYCAKNNLLGHNYSTALLELKKIRSAIKAGNLREFVELRIRSEPKLVAILRELDYRYYDFQEPYFPITKKSLIVTSRESFFRPDILRWYKRLRERYKKPESAKILLLLPCSAKKPYSYSKSHKIFKSVIASVKNYSAVHEVIVTSPLGIVPRELELFYPAQHYDIPVTGDWEDYEIKIINELLQWLVKNARFEAIINHTGYDFIELEAIKTCIGKSTSKEALSRLSKELAELCIEYYLPNEKRKVEDMLSRACFQFGKAAGEKLVANCKILGGYPNLRILKGKEQIGMLTGERGLISLTLEGAKILASSNVYCVEIDDFIVKGDIFAVGVNNATPEIRIGDDVAVTHKNELKAVGIAVMNAKEMVESDRGIAVKVRHYVKDVK
ncbi:MAG: archaeosine synthase subunit alpha [Candidatus Thermoplasmatota archaeon]